MIDIQVVRGDGLTDGGEVFDPLLSSVEAALARGRFEIDLATPMKSVAVDCTYSPDLQVGTVVEALDITTNLAVKGVVKSFSHVVEGVVVTTKLTLEVPA